MEQFNSHTDEMLAQKQRELLEEINDLRDKLEKLDEVETEISNILYERKYKIRQAQERLNVKAYIYYHPEILNEPPYDPEEEQRKALESAKLYSACVTIPDKVK